MSTTAAYYENWAGVAAVEAAAATSSADAEIAASTRALGLGGGERERAAVAKRDALAQAKAAWLARDAAEGDAKAWVTRHTTGEVVLEGDLLGGKKVVHVKDCSDCTIVLPAGVVLSKLFVESCSRLRLALHGRLLTGHLEVWRCSDCALAVHAPLGTLQADLCTGEMSAFFATRDCLLAIVSAGVPCLRVTVGDDDAAGADVGAAAGEERGDGCSQWVTRWVGGVLVTEKVVRDATDYPTTRRELAERAAAEGVDADALEASLAEKRAAAQQTAGNDAFKAGDFASAAAAYTSAMAGGGSGKKDNTSATLLANRAACWLKLGRFEAALADSERAVEMEPGHVKALFRKGLALKALGRLQEAGAALSAAQAAEPGNAAVRDAILLLQRAAAKAAAAG